MLRQVQSDRSNLAGSNSLLIRTDSSLALRCRKGAIHPITRSPRRRGRAGGSPRWDGRTTKPTAPSEKETEKERGSDDNRDRAGRSGFSANLGLQREGHGDD